MQMRSIRLTLMATLACLSGCKPITEASVVLDGPAQGLVFTAATSKSAISIGETAILTFTLRNPTKRSVTLQFNSSCQVMPHVAKSGGAVVYPESGGYGCYQALTSLTLEPGADVVKTLVVFPSTVTGSTPEGIGLALGRYSAYAELHNGDGRTRSIEINVVR